MGQRRIQMSAYFSFKRTFAIALKEFIQMRRNKVIIGMMIGIPLIQLILFGYAINSNPKHLDTIVYYGDSYSPFVERFISGLKNSNYFNVKNYTYSEKEAKDALVNNEAVFVVSVPPGFNRELLRNQSPSILLEADSVDPQTIGSAINVANKVFQPINRS